MIRKTAAELARYYLISHGAECNKIEKIFDYYFYFTYKGQKFILSCWLGNMDIRPEPGDWLGINLKYLNADDVDETNPEFDPEIFFKPLLAKLKKYTK